MKNSIFMVGILKEKNKIITNLGKIIYNKLKVNFN